MPKRWIITISQDNVQQTLEHKLIGLPARRGKMVKKMQPGDTVIFYVGKKRAGYGGPRSSVSQFGPICEITGRDFFGDTPLWTSKIREVFPCRVPISVISEGRVNATDIIPRLDFIRNKNKWGLYFLTGIKEIPENDYKTLLTAIMK